MSIQVVHMSLRRNVFILAVFIQEEKKYTEIYLSHTHSVLTKAPRNDWKNKHILTQLRCTMMIIIHICIDTPNFKVCSQGHHLILYKIKYKVCLQQNNKLYSVHLSGICPGPCYVPSNSAPILLLPCSSHSTYTLDLLSVPMEITQSRRIGF